MNMKNRRGQFFLIFAVIIGIAILVAATQFNKTSKDNSGKEMFEIRCQNYQNEIFKISQYVIENQPDKENEFTLIKQFSDGFYDYMNRSYDHFDLYFLYGNNTYSQVFDEDTKGAATHKEEAEYSIILAGITRTYNFYTEDSFYFYMKAKKGGEIYICE
jgi:hypothetical protein